MVVHVFSTFHAGLYFFHVMFVFSICEHDHAKKLHTFMFFTLLREEVETPKNPEGPLEKDLPEVPSVAPTQIEASPATTVPGFPEQTAPAVGVGGSSADMPPPAPVAKPGDHAFVEYTSTTCRKQWNLLGRVSTGPRATQFPELAKLFNGNKENKLAALRRFMANNEDLQATEAAFKFERQQSQTLTKSRKCLTITQMRQEGCSEFLAFNFE